jgi:hypothetical protein
MGRRSSSNCMPCTTGLKRRAAERCSANERLRMAVKPVRYLFRVSSNMSLYSSGIWISADRSGLIDHAACDLILRVRHGP